MARSLHKVQLIGNLTRDPELRYTPQGTAVINFSIATNRRWKDDSGAWRDEADFHRIVAWDKLAEICSNLLKKGAKTYVEGRLQTRSWETQDGQRRYITEVNISDMILLDSRGGAGMGEDFDVPEDFGQSQEEAKEPEKAAKTTKKKTTKKKTTKAKKAKNVKKEDEEDIPF
jgi:single-strand DNA-binding protein